MARAGRIRYRSEAISSVTSPGIHAFVPEWGQGGKHIVGDPVTGKLYEQALKYYDDDGAAIQYLRAFPHLLNEDRNQFHHRLEAYMETGTVAAAAPEMIVGLDWSDDRGHTFKTLPPLHSSGVNGDFDKAHRLAAPRPCPRPRLPHRRAGQGQSRADRCVPRGNAGDILSAALSRRLSARRCSRRTACRLGRTTATYRRRRDWWLYWNQLTDRVNSNSKLASEGAHADRPDPGSMPDGAIYIEGRPGRDLLQPKAEPGSMSPARCTAVESGSAAYGPRRA